MIKNAEKELEEEKEKDGSDDDFGVQHDDEEKDNYVPRADRVKWKDHPTFWEVEGPFNDEPPRFRQHVGKFKSLDK